MKGIQIAVPQDVIEANGDLPPGEPFSHGLFENAAGQTDEFVPAVSEECPKCYAGLRQFFVGGSSPDQPDSEVDRHRHLIDICPECNHIPYKDELVQIVEE